MREERTLGESIRRLWDAITREHKAPTRWRRGRADSVGKHTGHNQRKRDRAKNKRRRRMVKASRHANRRTR